MNEIVIRADAFREALSEHAAPQPLLGTVAICCEELLAAGHPHAALKLIELTEGPLESAPSDWRLKVQIAKARGLRMTGECEAAYQLCGELKLKYDDALKTQYDAQVDLAIVEAATLWQLNAFDEAERELGGIRDALLGKSDGPLLARCSFELASAKLFRGRIDEAHALALDSLVSARRCSYRYMEALALDNLARVEKYLCHWASAEDYAAQAEEVHRAEGCTIGRHISKRCRGIIAWKRGRLDEAQGIAEECYREASSLDSELHQTFAKLLKAGVLHHRGALREAAESLEDGNGGPRLQQRGSLLREELQAELMIEQDRPEGALQRLEMLEPLVVCTSPEGDIAAELPRRRAEAYVKMSQWELAHQHASVGLSRCRARRDRYEEAATYRTLALSAAALGRPAEAKKWFDQGFAYYDDIETPYEWGKLWMAYGDWLAGPHAAEYGDQVGAVEAHQAARDHFERMGALGMLKQVEKRLGDRAQPGAGKSQDDAAGSADIRRPLRRPRGSVELDRRSGWAKETFGFITRNKVVLDLLEDVSKLARSGSPILILGESGTGKELVAHGVHRLSGRTGNFMPINCGALPREVIESELFGHVAGAFTGATRDKAGLFEACHQGTVFLDEIAEMSPDLQSRLLRFLETGEFRRVGANRNVAVDTLVVAATNRDRAALESGDGFRVDLYYRLAHAVVVLPPLRRRGEDLDLLIGHLLQEACDRHGKPITFSNAARNRLIAYSWPGNVRQLRSTINRLVILNPAGHEVSVSEIELDEGQAPTNLSEELGQAERRKIVEALAAANGVRSEAAKILGMSRTTLIGKLQRYGIR